MKKESKKKYLIILLIVLLLGLAVGYAIFSDTLTITGTANAKGNLDVKFISCAIDDNSNGYDMDGTTAPTISADGKTLTVTAKDLGYPGAYVQYNAVIQNVGTIPAKVKKFTKTIIEGNEDNIEIVGLDGIPDEILQPNEKCYYSFYVRWKDTSTVTEDAIKYQLTVNYEQIQSETTPQEIHTHTAPGG